MGKPQEYYDHNQVNVIPDTVFDFKKDPPRQKQSFKDQCDINRIMDKAAQTGTLSHINQYEQQYGDFADFDYEDSMNRIAEANSMFYDLPAETRNEFGNKPSAFLAFVNDPANKPRLRELLPDLAQPGKQLINPVGPTPNEPPKAASTDPKGPPATETPPESASVAPAASQAASEPGTGS